MHRRGIRGRNETIYTQTSHTTKAGIFTRRNENSLGLFGTADTLL